jgi:hypothetical protein
LPIFLAFRAILFFLGGMGSKKAKLRNINKMAIFFLTLFGKMGNMEKLG